MQFRDYQLKAVDSIYSYFAESTGNPVVAMPTGTGKSLVIAGFCKSAIFHYPKTRILMLTHVKELIAQNLKQLIRVWPTAPAGVYSAGLNRRDAHNQIIFAGIDSVSKKAELFGHVDIVLIDEAHLVSPKDETRYQRMIAALRAINPKLKVVGFSATPYRLGLGPLTEGGIFTDICYDLTTFDSFDMFVENGWMAPLVTRKTTMEIDTASVSTVAGEFNLHELQDAVDKDSITRAAIDESLQLAHDRNHWLVFCAGIEHCEHVSSYLDSKNVSNVLVHSKMSNDERDRNIRAFTSGRVRVAINNSVLLTGFDYPEIDCIVHLRPTQSTVLWVQSLGRATRPADGKRNCLVLDFAGNTRRLGPINDPVMPRKKGDKKKSCAPVRVCPECSNYVHISARECPVCGYRFTLAIKIQPTAERLEVMLSKIEPPQIIDFKVDRVTYSKHEKVGKPPSLQVTYFCGLRMFREWLCFEHTGFPRYKAQMWWLGRFTPETEEKDFIPGTVDIAISQASLLSVPKFISVIVNRKYPEITGYKYVNPETSIA